VPLATFVKANWPDASAVVVATVAPPLSRSVIAADAGAFAVSHGLFEQRDIVPLIVNPVTLTVIGTLCGLDCTIACPLPASEIVIEPRCVPSPKEAAFTPTSIELPPPESLPVVTGNTTQLLSSDTVQESGKAQFPIALNPRACIPDDSPCDTVKLRLELFNCNVQAWSTVSVELNGCGLPFTLTLAASVAVIETCEL
jgi:hypothetical protein